MSGGGGQQEAGSRTNGPEAQQSGECGMEKTRPETTPGAGRGGWRRGEERGHVGFLSGAGSATRPIVHDSITERQCGLSLAGVRGRTDAGPSDVFSRLGPCLQSCGRMCSVSGPMCSRFGRMCSLLRVRCSVSGGACPLSWAPSTGSGRGLRGRRDDGDVSTLSGQCVQFWA